MKTGFYPKLALDGIRKNKQMYFPYILTCVMMAMVYYIILFLSEIRGETTKMFLDFGGWVIAVFSVIFLFYTNSFLIRRRKKEFGLYHILGMGKRHISLILLCECLIIYVISIVVGLIAGIALSKMADLVFVNVIGGQVSYEFSVSFGAVVQTIVLFSVIFILLFLNGLRQIHFSRTITLLQSEAVGEKPPKANWFLGILGLVCIVAGYVISLSIENPVSAIMGFFIAVLLVIIGTYFTLIAGSVLCCKLLQKSKKYYYKANHFVSVSSMIYRMKRNGAGLASICILATMVLVIISSTVSLYVEGEDSIRNHYPREINVNFQYNTFSEGTMEDIKTLSKDIRSVCDKYDVSPSNVIEYSQARVTGMIQNDTVETDITEVDEFSLSAYSNVVQFSFVSLEDYNRMRGTDFQLSDDEVLLISNRYDYSEDSISFNSGKTFKIAARSEKMIIDENSETVLPVICCVTADLPSALKGLDKLTDYTGGQMLQYNAHYYFDTGLSKTKQENFLDDLTETISSGESYDKHRFEAVTAASRESNRDGFYQLYGSMLYLGVILSLVFLMAAVLMIYYKQISEGYEDQKRFAIMQKIGMTKREIRKSINSQLLTVFFLPLVLAGLHLAFAFPIISQLLMTFNLVNNMLLLVNVIICFIVFALFYAVIYKMTSNAYYRIVVVQQES